MTTLQKRLAISAVLVSIAVFTIFHAPYWFFILVTEILVLLGAYEFFALARKKGIAINLGAGLTFTAIIPLAMYWNLDGLALVLACLVLFVASFRKEYLHQALTSTAVTIFGLVYIAWFFSHLIPLRLLPNGAGWVFYTALIVKGGDAGAYFVGRKIGKTKLIEHVSPNKSVEGAVAGLVTTVILSFVSMTFLPGVAWYHFLILGVIGGIVSQLGDLGESLLKRDAGIKDSGQIPGLGGVFDVLDSLLIASPVIFYYVAAVIL